MVGDSGPGGLDAGNRDEMQGKKSRVLDIIHTGSGNELMCFLRIWLEFTLRTDAFFGTIGLAL